MKFIGALLGAVVMVGSVIVATIVAIKLTAATFAAVAAIAVPIIIAYLAAAIVFGNLMSIVIGLFWFIGAALISLLAMSNEDIRTRAFA